jgi:hypothetical protein
MLILRESVHCASIVQALCICCLQVAEGPSTHCPNVTFLRRQVSRRVEHFLASPVNLKFVFCSLLSNQVDRNAACRIAQSTAKSIFAVSGC